MGIQSGVMAQQFGMNFQFGKRKISAMSNEEFNKLTPQQMQADFANTIKGLIPTFEQSLKDMRPFQRMIFVEMLAAMTEAVKLGIDVGKAGADSIAHLVGGHIGHGDVDKDKPDTEHSFLSPVQQRAHIRHGHRQEIEDRYGKPEIKEEKLKDKPGTHRHTPEHHLGKNKVMLMWNEVKKLDATIKQFIKLGYKISGKGRNHGVPPQMKFAWNRVVRIMRTRLWRDNLRGYAQWRRDNG